MKGHVNDYIFRCCTFRKPVYELYNSICNKLYNENKHQTMENNNIKLNTEEYMQ